CFGNACGIALGDITADGHPRYAYCEGYYGGSIIPIHHAWLYDRQTGKAVEVTLRPPDDFTCPFCAGEGEYPREDHDDCEDCGGDGPDWGCEAVDQCKFCDETGVNTDGGRHKIDAEYIGIEFTHQGLIRLLQETGTYDVLGA